MNNSPDSHITDSFESDGALARLTELGVQKTIDTFVVAKSVAFIVRNRLGWDAYITASSGDMINLGNGAWIYAGTASGVSKGKPFSGPWNFEYDPVNFTLTMQIFGKMNKFVAPFDPDMPVQLRVDVNGLPVLLLVRVEVVVDDGDSDYSQRATAGSYIQFS